MRRLAWWIEERPWAAGVLAFTAVTVWWSDLAAMSAGGWF